MEVGAEEYSLAYPLIKVIARSNNDPNNTSYRKGCKIRPVVEL